MSLQDLNAVNTQEQLDYAKYLDQLGQFNTDRNFAFNSYLSDFDILQSQLGALQGQDNIDYNRWMDKVGLHREDQQLQREEALAQQQMAQAQVDAILSAGGSPSADLVGTSGYTNEYVQALQAAYQRQLATKSGGGSSGGSRSSGGGSKMTLTTAKQAANAGVFSDEVLAVLRNNGYTDEMLEAIYGYEPNGGGSGGGSSFNQLYNRLSIILSEETPDNAQSLVDRLLTDDVWDSLSASEQNRIQQLLRNYGSVE